MLGTLSIITMRKKHDETTLSQPLRFPRANKLIDNDLCRVRKVTKLRLPQDQSVGMLQRVTEFKAENAVLRKLRVAHGKEVSTPTHVSTVHITQRDEAFAGDLIVEQSMAMREGAAFDILSR